MSMLLIVGLKNAILVVPLALLAMAAGRWARRPALTHLLWTLVLVKMVTPPLLHVPIGWQVDVESWVRQPAIQSASATPAIAKSATPEKSLVSNRQGSKRIPAQSTSNRTPGPVPSRTASASYLRSLNWGSFWRYKFEILAAIWLSGSLYVLFKLARRSYQFHRFLNLVEKRDESLGPRAAELAVRARIGIAPRVVVVDSVVSPMLWGMGRRACLVFPSRLVERLAPAELDSLLLHELAHFARGDHWVRVLELVTSIVYWWHPIFWWARHELEIAEEQCCDAWVVERQTGGRLSYAEALLATIDFLHEPATARPPVACGLGEVPFLKTRLTQIMRGDVAARLPNSLTCAILVTGVLCAPLEPTLWANGTSNSAAISQRWSSQAASTLSTPTPAPSTPPLANSPTEATPSKSATEKSPGSTEPPKTPPTRRPNLLLGSSLPRVPKAHFASAHSPDGKYRLEARVGQNTTLVMGANGSLNLAEPRITYVAFAPDSKTFATGHEDHLVRLWASTGGNLRPFRGADSPIRSVQISPNGHLLAAGTRSGTVVVWDIETGDVVRRLEEQGSEVSCLRWSATGDRLAVSLGAWTNQEEVRLVVWAPTEDRVLLNQSLDRPIGAIDWMPQGDMLLVASWDGTAGIMNITTGIVESEMQLDKDRVSAAAWSSDCPLLDRVRSEFTVLKTGN